jgi:hypothetical protein
MTRVLKFEGGLASDGLIELSNDRPSGRLFWTVLLNYAASEDCDEVRLKPNDGDECLTVVVAGERLSMVPPPTEVQELFLEIGREIALGRLQSLFFNCPGIRSLVPNRALVSIEADGHLTDWSVECDSDSIKFAR